MKYLLSALLLCGAFLFLPAQAQDSGLTPVCATGETPLTSVYGCGVIKPLKSCELKDIVVPSTWGYGSPYIYTSTSSIVSRVTSSDYTNDPPYGCSYSQTQIHHTSQTTTISGMDTSCPQDFSTQAVRPATITKTTNRVTSTGNSSCALVCTVADTTPLVSTGTHNFTYRFLISDTPTCPVSHPMETTEGSETYCYYIPEDTTPPPCNALDCEQPEDPKCFRGGNGMLICESNPDEKCTKTDSSQIGASGEPLPVYSNCQAGCGFVVDKFMCGEEPSGVPNFELCEVTQTGYACPSEKNDQIADATKQTQDMTKQDFKDVNIGVESRQDTTNDLLSSLLANDKNSAEALHNQLQGQAANISNHLNGLGSKLDGIGTKIDGVGDKIDETFNPSETRPIPEPSSWYESKYENGVQGVWDDYRQRLNDTSFFQFLNQFSLSPSGTQPDWNMCFNLGALGNYGCERIEVPAFIWNFVRLCILVTAGFTCRRIIFGG